ncbi:HAD domain-containing protein [Aureimonas pseudogalii]|uniref:Polynucleotide kinase n=1 Tax=Aureimonas pseudogalii TaxID=1744844 RepID=A0A7W6H2P8_9HYPH|nr:HAD domain-containing protein [Aureimonas pseudogalii]MBB3997261.1 hypothetical protein [Aureimonas pseudogalii]
MSAVLFLDVDGVLNNEAVFRDRRFGPFPIDHQCVERVHTVVRETGCEIVLSSSWRGMEKLESKLVGDGVFSVYRDIPGRQFGEFAFVRHQDGQTKRLEGRRGPEIAEWLSRHPEVDRYAILDDESDMLPEQMPHFVKTEFQGGIMDEHVPLLAAALARSLSEDKADG